MWDGYNGDAISDSEWGWAEEADLDQRDTNEDGGFCIICGGYIDENGWCENGCYY